MSDPKESGHLEPRDVLAERIEKWADDWKVYDYADRLLNDLDAAGFEVRPKAHDPEADVEETGATLMLGIHIPEASEEGDPDEYADGLLGSINNLRKSLGGERLMISLWPTPQWFSKGTMDVLRRANELVLAEQEPTDGA